MCFLRGAMSVCVCLVRADISRCIIPCFSFKCSHFVVPGRVIKVPGVYLIPDGIIVQRCKGGGRFLSEQLWPREHHGNPLLPWQGCLITIMFYDL